MSIDWLSGLSPADIQLPVKFDSWRPIQIQAVNQSLNCNSRFIAQAMPVGTGKSLTYLTEILMRGEGRAAILTSTKGLQDQLTADFAECGLVAVKGRNNFSCVSNPYLTCEEGAYAGCRHRSGPECPYRAQVMEGAESRIIVTNYSYWTLAQKMNEPLGKFDLLVLDEAHDAPDAICQSMAVEITEADLERLRVKPPPHYQTAAKPWREWAVQLAPQVAQIIASYQQAMKDGDMGGEELRAVKHYNQIAMKLQGLSRMGDRTDWVVEEVRHKHAGSKGAAGWMWRIEPVWPAQYAESALFRGIPRVVLFSATLLPKTLRLLGVPEAQSTFHEYRSPFPPQHSPVYYIPVLRNNYKATQEDLNKLLAVVDEIVGSRSDRKGIIHATSYQRAEWIATRSRYAHLMMTHTNQPGEAMRTAEMFRTLDTPAVLVSPSVTTGYDFPYESCEYQILVKCPYSDPRSPVAQRRAESDQTYAHYTMAQELMQSSGRGMRAPDDRCETFILDATFGRIYAWKPGLFSRWFQALVRRTDRVPPAPPSLASLRERGVVVR